MSIYFCPTTRRLFFAKKSLQEYVFPAGIFLGHKSIYYSTQLKNSGKEKREKENFELQTKTFFPMKEYFTAEITAMFSKVPIVKNLARQKFMLMFVLGLIRSRKVQFCEVAQYLNDEAQDKSNEVRIQDFFAKWHLTINRLRFF